MEEKKEEQKTYTMEDFAKEYQTLCEKTGWNIVSTPTFLKRDDGTYSLVIQFSVGRLPNREVVKIEG